MSSLCELPFDPSENCSITLEESFEPYSSTFRLVWICLISVLFLTMTPFDIYYLCFMRRSEKKGPVKTAKFCLALATPLIIILCFLYGFLRFFWRHDARSIEGKLSFMILTTCVILGVNLMMANQVALSETMAVYSEKDYSKLLFKLSFIWQVTALVVCNSVFLFADLSFTQALILSTFTGMAPQVFLAPYNIFTCLNFRAVIQKHIESELSTGKDAKNLVKIYRDVSKTLNFLIFGSVYFVLDAMVLVPFFQENISFVLFQTMGKIFMVTIASPFVSQYFLKIVKEDMSNALITKMSLLRDHVESRTQSSVAPTGH